MSVYELIESQKKGKIALYEGYQYSKNGEQKDTTYWRYSNNRCPGRMNTVGMNVKKVLDHSHAPDVRKEVCRKVLGNIRNLAATTNDKPRNILRNATCLVDERVSSVELPSNSNATRMIRRVRKKKGEQSKTPKTLLELTITGLYLLTLKGDKFLFFDQMRSNKRTIIFTTHLNLAFLSHCEDWYMDGTFDVVPPLFKQLYSIHGRRYKTYLPLVYILTCGKDVFTYMEIFSKLKEFEPQLNPKKIMIDFEMAAIKSLKEVFPEADVYGCFFHMCKCIYRKIQEHGLQTIYGADATFAQYMRCLASLAFVPPATMINTYTIVRCASAKEFSSE
ncbi:hypothetical protein HA402_002730 [Bradysia odoriphaga]|nr:hypothetical protein HA402_002730 [Bradysia odoriphaga]